MVDLSPHDPSGKARLAKVLRALGKTEDGQKLVVSLEGIRMPHALFLQLRGEALQARADEGSAKESWDHALWLNPLDPDVACQLTNAPPTAGSPADPARSALCDAARHASRR